jgi:hypothetical protein
MHSLYISHSFTQATLSYDQFGYPIPSYNDGFMGRQASSSRFNFQAALAADVAASSSGLLGNQNRVVEPMVVGSITRPEDCPSVPTSFVAFINSAGVKRKLQATKSDSSSAEQPFAVPSFASNPAPLSSNRNRLIVGNDDDDL